MSKLAPEWQKTSVFETVFDQLADALVLYDPAFRITGVNRSAESSLANHPRRCSENTATKYCAPW